MRPFNNMVAFIPTILIILNFNAMMCFSNCTPGANMVKINGIWYGKTASAVYFGSALGQCATEFGADSVLASLVTAQEFEAVKSALNFYKDNGDSRNVFVDAKNPTKTICRSAAACAGIIKSASSGATVDASALNPEPDLNSNTFDCVYMQGSSTAVGKLIHSSCDVNKIPFCQLQCNDAGGASTTCPPVDDMKEESSNGLFYFLTPHEYEWEDAAGACTDRGMQLADVSDKNKHTIVLGHFGTGTPNKWVDAWNPSMVSCNNNADCRLQFQSTSGQPIDTDGYSVAPNTFGADATNKCLKMTSSGRLEDERCTIALPVVCQSDCVTVTTTTPTTTTTAVTTTTTITTTTSTIGITVTSCQTSDLEILTNALHDGPTDVTEVTSGIEVK